MEHDKKHELLTRALLIIFLLSELENISSIDFGLQINLVSWQIHKESLKNEEPVFLLFSN